MKSTISQLPKKKPELDKEFERERERPSPLSY